MKQMIRSALGMGLAILLTGLLSLTSGATDALAQDKDHRTERLVFPTGRSVPYLCSQEFRKPQPQAQFAIIVIHGYERGEENNLKRIMDVPADTFVLRAQALRLNWMNVIVEDGGQTDVNEITLAELVLNQELQRSALLVSFDRQEV